MNALCIATGTHLTRKHSIDSGAFVATKNESDAARLARSDTHYPLRHMATAWGTGGQQPALAAPEALFTRDFKRLSRPAEICNYGSL